VQADESQGHDGDDGDRRLTRRELRILGLLGIPTYALALAITLVTTYMPPLAKQFVGSTVVIGVIVGLEGLLALWLPLVVGTWSDRLRTRFGARLPFLAMATPVAAAALLVVGFVRTLPALFLAAFVFFFAYFWAYEPYRAMYPDAIPEEIAGRSQSSQAVFRGLGTGSALLGGGLLLGLAEPAPFVAGAAVLVVAMVAFAWALRRYSTAGETQREREDHDEDDQGLSAVARHVRDLVAQRPDLRAYMAANALWELALGALKTFVILYLTKGLGFGTAVAALIVGGVALVVLAGSVVAGKLGDRFGELPVMGGAMVVFGVPVVAAAFVTNHAILLSLTIVAAVGGGAIMSLPYGILIPLMSDEDHGTLTGLYSMSRGVGTALGPLLTGAAVTLLGGTLTATHGYGAMWLVVGAGALLSIWPVRRLSRRSRDDPELHA
jgi:MFS family permease